MPTNHISNSLAALLAVFYGHHAEENSSKVSHLFPGGNGDTPLGVGFFRTGQCEICRNIDLTGKVYNVIVTCCLYTFLCSHIAVYFYVVYLLQNKVGKLSEKYVILPF